MKLKLDMREAFRSYYDRLIAFAAVVALAASLAALAARMGAVKSETNRFRDWDRGLTPAFAEATNVVLDSFARISREYVEPFQLSAWERRMSVPELRVSCIDCLRPIPYEAAVCPVCNAQQTAMVSKDKDEDGMLDEWELKYNLNPLDPTDAHKDLDGDGFTNLEEFLYGTDPTDPKSHPPLIVKLEVVEIKAMPFHLKFMAVNKFTDGEVFQINSTRSGRTSWFRMGEEVEGYRLAEYEFREVEEAMGGGSVKVKVDRSILHLKSKTSDRTIPLRKGEEVPISDYEVRFFFAPDGSEFSVKPGGVLRVRGETYSLKDIDIRESRVLIRDDKNNKETWIGRKAQSGVSRQTEGREPLYE